MNAKSRALYIGWVRIAWFSLVLLLVQAAVAPTQTSRRPNILWLTSEDNGPSLGAYGDTYATTPTFDKLASRGMIYTNAWSNAPVCAPARTTIISGMYPISTGSEHMRSSTRLPAKMKMYPQYLRDAGYYCTNNSKEDYNLEKDGQVWDESSDKAHWRNRKQGQPFFAVFNFLTTHESQIRKRPHKAVHDPAKVRIPAYHPDTPEVRKDWAQYHDKMTEMDRQSADVLAQLEQDGLSEDTIVFYYGDHGPGMPRSKRWPYNSGLRVPLIVHIPEKYRDLAPADWKPGGKRDQLVSFVDLAPTLLKLAGIDPPRQMQGQPFLATKVQQDRSYVYGFRGRMDERIDLVRSVRDQRYVYIRNFMPHKIYGQHISYMFETPTTRVWKQLYDEGKLKPPQTFFWETKPAEELYDLSSDPDEVKNLAESAGHADILKRLRKAVHDWQIEVRDVGLLPEGEIHSRANGGAPYDVGHDPKRYPIEQILATAELASSMKPDAIDKLEKALSDPDSAVRYWGALGILIRGSRAAEQARQKLEKALTDPSPHVRVVAAETLGRYCSRADQMILQLLELANVEKHGVYVSISALNALEELGKKTKLPVAAIKALPRKDPAAPERAQEYVPRLIETFTSGL